MKSPPLRSFHVENFKAIQDSRSVKFGWLTVFIGNNGSGKSSLVEALETFRDVVLHGVDQAFLRWKGFEQVWNKSRERELVEREGHRIAFNHPMRFRFDLQGKKLSGRQEITQGPGGNSLFIQMEQLIERQKGGTEHWLRHDSGEVFREGQPSATKRTYDAERMRLGDGRSMFKRFALEAFEHWQFLMLNPDRMGQPTTQQRATKTVQLARDGSNVAEYLNEIRELDREAFEGILEALRYVLPYAEDLQPTLTSELERAFYLKLKEGSFEVPGWLLSTGTLRVVALLALLRHPNPPPLICIEEIENGLDPRTLQLIVSEIRALIESERSQVILTTHSPYLLDLLPLSSIIMTQRTSKGVTFTRPGDSKEVQSWAEDFAPGQLYLMNRLDAKGD